MKKRTSDTPIPMPMRGVDKTQAAGRQRPDTTSDAENMRSVGKDKRLRIEQRPGMAKHYPYAMAGPVRAIATLVYENKTITYEATEDELESNGDGRTKHTEVWKKLTEQKKDVRNIAVAPLSGNVYAVSGNVVEKRNGDGVLQWGYSINLPKKGFVLAAMALGPDEAVHVAVSEGDGGAKGAAIYRVKETEIDIEGNVEPVLEWTYTTDGWVRELMMDGSELKALVQFDDKRRSYVWTFGNLTYVKPQAKGSYQVPYPSTCMAIKPDGSSITGHPYFLDRDTTPGKPGVGVSLESWTISDMEDANSRVWADWNAEDLVGLYEHGQEVTAWDDSRGTGRVWLKGQAIEAKQPTPGPTLNLKGSLEKPTLLFNGIQGLFSQKGGGIMADKDSCMSAVPNHGDGAFAIFIVCRPSTTTTEGELDENGQPLETRRWLFHQFHHTQYGGVAGPFDTKNTKAHCSGIVVNSGSNPPDTDDDLYCWGKSKSLRGSHEPGMARPFTSSSGYRFSGAHNDDGYDAGAWTAGSSNFDYPGMPLLRGAGKYGWPKEGQFADTSSAAAGAEGWCVMTFMHDGGLSEYYDLPVTGTSLISFSIDTVPDWWASYPDGAEGEIFLDGSTSGIAFTKSGNQLLVLSGGDFDPHPNARIVWNRNHQTRCVWRINGVPIDRWEALPMAYKGPSTTSSPSPGDIITDLNVEHNQTGLGNPLSHDYIRGFVGEVARIVVVGNRTGADSSVTIDSSKHFPAPTVMTHPKYAINAHMNDTATASDADHSYKTVPTVNSSTEMEKVEGWLMNHYGIGKNLQPSTAAYPSPHYPEVVANKTWDVPLADYSASSGQAWIARLREPDAMLTKYSASGQLLWCLKATNGYGAGTFGDLFYEDLNGTGGVNGFTDAEATCGVAIGKDDDIFVVGAGTGANDGLFCMGRITDKFQYVQAINATRILSVGWWTQGAPSSTDSLLKATFVADETIRCKCDEFGNFYVPFSPTSQWIGFPAKDAFRAYTREGASMFRLTTLNHGSQSYQNGYAVAFPPTSPDYNLDE